ncbi:helix-turn-helix domain-containing protein [Paenibacillus pinistramenti]|uniref:helix-turn-helix domain-containing protein n=1 Tax=Paenibacillus pinistramenti TaxID=1768003 RepID=UPI001107D669|nr:helix-turn-helix domain-containing protein [Paenibacillus pinistramenti]
MSDLGQQLREARMARGLSLDDVQEMTKIRKRYLEAIEAGDYKVLPGSFYVRAFIKTYAEAVGVNADDLLTEHQSNVPSADPEPVMEPVLQRRRTKPASEGNSKWLPTLLMWSFLVVIVAVIYLVVINNNKGDGNQAADPTPVTSGEIDPSSAAGGAVQASSVPSAAVSSDASATPSVSPSPDPSSSEAASSADSSAAPAVDGVVVTQDGKTGSALQFNVQSPNQAPVPVQITASGGRSWVEVRQGDKNGDKLFYATMEDGDTISYNLDSQGMYIKSGASPYTTITVGGQPVVDDRNTAKIQLSLVSGDTAGTDGGNSLNTGTEESTQP